ncbi:MAG: TlpA disulfide reductase family protein [Syntrophales bacterium]|nr:TlpA disulfide reductase family protein [Syntrophales bacterium]
MKKRGIFITLLAAVIITITVFPTGLFAQGKVKDFSLTDIQGQRFNLKDYNKKTVLLIFGTTWCPSCRAEIPHFKQIFTTYSQRGLQVFYINIQESKDTASRFSAKYQLPYRTLLDPTGSVATSWDVMGVPAMVLVKDGKVVTRDYRLIDGYLDKLYARKTR